MPEAQTELDAENTLLAAVMAPDVGDIDRTEDRAITSPQEAEAEPAEEAAPEQKAEEPAAVEDDDFIEVALEEGAAPAKIPLKEAVAAYQEREQFKANLARERDSVLAPVREQAQQVVQNVRRYAEETGHHLQAVMQLIQPPQPPQAPPPDVANPMSPNYNPDAAAQYTLQRAQWEQAMGRFNQVRAYAGELAQRAQVAQQWQEEQRLDQELERLKSVWPDFDDPKSNGAFITDMQREYGFSPEELDASLTDHRAALVARDALAYRAMKAKAPEVKAKVQQIAPKVVRSNAEAKGGTAASRDDKGRYTAGALEALKKTNSDDAAAAYFASLSRAGRI